MRPPAFQFYPDDFVAGTVGLSTEEVGAYIRLLCFQWGNGKLSSDIATLERIAGGKVSKAVLSKFPRGKNRRLEVERRKQQEYRDKQRLNGLASAKARLNRGSTTVQPPLDSGSALVDDSFQPKGNSPSPSPSPCTVRERMEIPFPETPNWETVKFEAERIGLPEWKAFDWFNEMEGCGWKDHQSRQINRWQSVILRVKIHWETLGRPSQSTNHSAKKPVNLIIHNDELKRIENRLKKLREGYDSNSGYTRESATEIKELNHRKKELRDLLGVKA